MTKVSPMTILRRTKSYSWRKGGLHGTRVSAMTTPEFARGGLWRKQRTSREGTQSRDKPAPGEGCFVVENKGLDGKGPCPVTTLRLARGDLWWKI
jgi:hypothetical protein